LEEDGDFWAPFFVFNLLNVNECGEQESAGLKLNVRMALSEGGPEGFFANNEQILSFKIQTKVTANPMMNSTCRGTETN